MEETQIKSNYQNWQAEAPKADLLAKFMTMAMDIALKAGKMEPIALPPSPKVGISISPSGKIEPALLNNQYRQPGVIIITFEEFEAIAQRLKSEMLKGTVVPKSEDEIPKLIYRNLIGGESQS